MSEERKSEAISPTAHYTGYVWYRNGLSHPELATLQGRLLFETLRAPMAISSALGGPSLEGYLLARHRGLDARLAQAIEQEGVTQAIEVASGLSPRGWRFTGRYGDRLTYVETDIPAMAARKRRALARMGSLGERHRVEEVDALRDRGPGSLAAVAESLNPGEPLAVLTEGLLGYFDRDQVLGTWRRFAAALAGFRAGLYLSDLHLARELAGRRIRAFRTVLSMFVRGRVHVHFRDESEAAAALAAAGFTDIGVHRPDQGGPASGPGGDRSAGLVRVLVAAVGRRDGGTRGAGASLAQR